MNRKVLLTFLGIIAIVITFIACNDLNVGLDQSKNESELITKAKVLVKSYGSNISLPTTKNHNHSGLSRGSVSSIATLEPQWDLATRYNTGDEDILIVPLHCDEDIRSRINIKHGEESSYQFAKTFSRMIVKGEHVYVLTYMPESNYASTHVNIENELKYNPTDVNFTGMIIASKLSGSINRGYLYENGTLAHYFAPAHECHHENCTEEHNHTNHSDMVIKLNLFPANESRSTTYTSDSETYYCPVCLEIKSECKCVYIYEACEKCLQPLQYCTCYDDDRDPENDLCAFCGRLKELCTCDGVKCDVCKSNPCVCKTCAGCPNSECSCQDGGSCLCD